jgi:hypothetical protein
MQTCDDFLPKLWDLAYDLLDAGETESLRIHLVTCPACQAAQERVEDQQRQFAQAALVRRDIPPFVPPIDEPAVIFTRPSLAATTGTRRPIFAWKWVGAAAAAVLLLALPYLFVERGIRQRREVLDEAHHQLAHLVAVREEARQEVQRKETALPADIRSQHLRLQVLGPASYQPQGPNYYRILATNLDGQPAEARVAARLLDANRKVLFEKQDVTAAGTMLLSLPQDLPVDGLPSAQLEVTARGSRDLEEVQESLNVLTPAYTTHLITDKPIYRPGERVFYRSLTLDSFSLKPPKRPFTARYQITEPGGTKHDIALGTTTPDGFGGGELWLAGNTPDGEYTLTVIEQENRFASVSCRYLVRAEPRPRLRKTLTFARNAYEPGDPVEARLRVEHLDGSGPVADLPVTILTEVNGKDTDLPRQFRTDVKGQVVIPWQLPVDIGLGTSRIRVSVTDRGQRETLQRTVPRAVHALEVEFFPEGGDLIAGLPNRVYFRARDSFGAPAQLEGEIVDKRGNKVAEARTLPAAVQASSSTGLGSFSFTPEVGQTYRLKITTPAAITNTPALPPVQADGISLHLQTGVTRENEPLEGMVYVAGKERQLVVGVACRGRFVAEEYLRAQPGPNRIRLMPAAGSRGVVRVTVFERQGQQLRPLAERLVYRIPAERLRLSVHPEKNNPAVGDAMKLTVRSENEDGKPEPAWLLVSVTNDDVPGQVANPGRHGLAAAFHVASEIQKAEDLEGVDILLRDDAAAAMELDHFLGTQGWRRLKRVQEQPSQPDALLALDNSEAVERKTAAALTGALASLRGEAAKRDQELTQEAEQALQEARAAEQALDAFQTNAGLVLRVSLGTGVLLLFGIGCLFLLAGLFRLLRGQMANSLYFAGAFASLLLCVGLFWSVKDRLGSSQSSLGSDVLEPLAIKVERPLAFPAELQGPRPAAATGVKPLLAQPLLNPQPNAPSTVPLRLREAPELAALPRTAPKPNERPGPLIRPMRIQQHAQPMRQQDAPPLAIREYAYFRPKGGLSTPPPSPDTILWQPVLFAADGTAQVTFDLPEDVASFRIEVEANSPTGRLGSLKQALKAGTGGPASK